MADIHVGDVGTMLRIAVKDKRGEIFRLEDAVRLFVRLAKPDRSIIERSATLYTDGTDGVMAYVTAVGDLDQRGRWKIQAIIEKPSGRWSSSIITFKVLPNLE